MARGLPLAHHDQPQSSIAARTRSVTSAAVAFQTNGTRGAQMMWTGLHRTDLPERRLGPISA